MIYYRKGYRDNLEIVRDILKVIIDAGELGAKKTHVMYGANLSYLLLTKYLKEVLAARLIHNEDSRFIITEKGKEFLNVYSNYGRTYEELMKHSMKLNNGKHKLEKFMSKE